MVGLKIDKKALLRAAKEDKPDKSNFTFRLDSELYEKFKTQCEKNKVKPTAVLEAFLKEFTKA